MAPTLYALLVGIDTYPNPAPPLYGCVNDVRCMQDFIEHRLSSGTQARIEMLVNAEATRDAIIHTFLRHLGKAQSGDTALFYFSGHGSQEIAPPMYRHLEPDGLNETLIAYDSRRDGGWDIADKEMTVLIADVASRGAHIVVFLDSCHSGGATRLADDAVVRRFAADKRSRPAESYWFYDQGKSVPEMFNVSNAWRILPEGQHVLLAACRDFELAAEFTSPDGKPRGIFSYYLLEVLRQLGPQSSYRNLHKQAQTLVNNRNPFQLPQAVGDADRGVFSGLLSSRRRFYYVRNTHETGWVLDAGAAHGIQRHSEIAILPPDSTDPDDWSNLTATARVTRVGAGDSLVEMIGGSLPAGIKTLPAVITHLPLPPLRVALMGDLPHRADIKSRLDRSPYLELAPDAADLRVFAEAGSYRVRKPPAADDLLSPFSAGAIIELVHALEHIAKWETVANLHSNCDVLSDAVEMNVYEWLKPPSSGEIEPQVLAFQPGQEIRLPYRTVQGEAKARRFTVKITNKSRRPFFFALLALSENFAINIVSHAYGRLIAGSTIWVRAQDGIDVSVPDKLYAKGVTQWRDMLLLLVSDREVDFGLLEQGPWGMPYRRRDVREPVGQRLGALDVLMQRVGNRDAKASSTSTIAHQWTAQRQIVIAERPLDLQDTERF